MAEGWCGGRGLSFVMLGRATVLVLIAASAIVVVADPALAVCPLIPDPELLAAADSVFDGVALEGPTNEHGQLVSPARFQIAEYIKGEGPGIVLVETQVRSPYDPIGQEDFWAPGPGESWRLFAFALPEGDRFGTPSVRARVVSEPCGCLRTRQHRRLAPGSAPRTISEGIKTTSRRGAPPLPSPLRKQAPRRLEEQPCRPTMITTPSGSP